MVVIQDIGEVLMALTANHDLVALPQHICVAETLGRDFLLKKNFVTAVRSFYFLQN